MFPFSMDVMFDSDSIVVTSHCPSNSSEILAKCNKCTVLVLMVCFVQAILR